MCNGAFQHHLCDVFSGPQQDAGAERPCASLSQRGGGIATGGDGTSSTATAAAGAGAEQGKRGTDTTSGEGGETSPTDEARYGYQGEI